jgi:hypothetical protein
MFSAGLLLPLAVTFYFKFTVPPPNDIVGNRAIGELLAKILDPARHLTIAEAFLKGVGSFGHWPIHPGIPLLAILMIWGVDRHAIRGAAWKTAALTIGLVLGGYFAVYVITPKDLDYHLATSLDRLLMHVWPSVLFLAGLAVSRSATASGSKVFE